MDAIRRRSKYVPPEETKKKGSAGISIVVGGFFLLAALGTAWGLGAFGRRADARVVEVQHMAQDLQKQMSSGGPQNEAEAKVLAESMVNVMKKAGELPDELRGEAFRGMMRGGMMAAQQSNMNSFFAAKPEDRDKVLDQQIKSQQMMQKAMAAAGGWGGGRGGFGGGGGPGGGGGGPGGGGGGGAAGGAGGGPGGGGRGGWAGGGNMESFRKQMLDGTSPSQRAQINEYREAMDRRRQQLGIGPGWGGGR